MGRIDPRFVDPLESLRRELEAESIEWALTGSANFALQGVPVEPNDIDVQTTERGAYRIEELFSDHVVDPVSFSESNGIRSHFGKLELNGISVEIMGDLQKRLEDGTWEASVDIPSHREFVTFRGHELPVLSLRYEEEAYAKLGRTERVALLRRYID